MSTIVIDCPFCAAKSVGFEIETSFPSLTEEGICHAPMRCGACSNYVMAQFRRFTAHRVTPENDIFKGTRGSAVRLLQVFPAPPEPKTIYGLPANIEGALHSAEQTFVDNNLPAAGAMYRRTIERAVRHFDPEGKGMLNARIRAIEKAQSLPAALISLLDQVKLFGNNAIHDDVDPTEEDITDAREFTHLFLEYTFALPKRVEEAAARRNAERN